MSIYSPGGHFYDHMGMVAPLTQSVLEDPALLKIGFGSGMVFLGSVGLAKSGVGQDFRDYFSGTQAEKTEPEAMLSKAGRYGLSAISAIGIGVGMMAIGAGAMECTGASVQKVVEAPLNLCESRPGFCDGHMNIPRKEMPQIDGKVKTAYLNWWESQGTRISCKQMNASHLKSTQSELNHEKVMDMLFSFRNRKWDPCAATILVSSDGHVLDGHHRWATCLLAYHSLSVTEIDAPIQKLLDRASVFNGVEHHGLGEMRPI